LLVEMKNEKKEIPIWHDIRENINNIEKYEDEIKKKLKYKIDIYEHKINLMISYLFGTSIDETYKKKKEEYATIGNDFYVDTINDIDALILDIHKTARKARKKSIAIPLNPKYEEWSKEILEYSENIADNEIFKGVCRPLQAVIKICFNKFLYPAPGYKDRKNRGMERVNVTHKHLSEIREWELGLCHNFKEYDFTNFFGGAYKPDYNVYFNKLLERNDYYNKNDIRETMILKNVVFNPSSNEKYHYNEYLDIVRKIKREYIKKYDDDMNINTKLFLTKKDGKKGKEPHDILKSNVISSLKSKSKNILTEYANYDVVDLDQKKVYECGHTSAKKLLDCFGEEYKEIKNINQFYVLQFYDKNNKSKLYKFQKMDTYR